MPHPSNPSINPALIPLLSTTATLTLALYETVFFKTHLSSTSTPQNSRTIARSLSLWWRNSIPTTLPVVLSLITASLISGIRAYRALSPILQSTKRYIALAGALLAVAHLAFAPKVAGVIQDMAYAYERVGEWKVDVDVEEQGRTKEEAADEAVLEGQRMWLRVHYLRTLVTDLPAWGCFAWLVFGKH